MPKTAGARFSDLYRPKMMVGYPEEGLTEPRACDRPIRNLPSPRGFAMATGLDGALQLCANRARGSNRSIIRSAAVLDRASSLRTSIGASDGTRDRGGWRS